ncbi:hypothetical protein MTO96_019884 [Rhipicephalus appendiculatus]
MGKIVIGVAAYVAASDNTCKGVIRGINLDLSDTELTELIVNRRNPGALGVRRIKKTPTVIVLFDGQKVPPVRFVRWCSLPLFLVSQASGRLLCVW